MDSYEDAALCPVCYSVYDDPRSLPCGHTFCLKCISQVAYPRNQASCPSCRKIVNLNYQGANGLPKNYGLVHIIEVHKKMSPNFCSDHKKSLDMFCEQCDVVICSKCLLNSHSEHRFVDIEVILNTRKGRLTELLESTKPWQAQIEEKTDEIRSSRQSVKKTAEKIKEEIDDKFRRWSDDLEKGRQSLQRIVDLLTERWMKVYDDRLRVLYNVNTKINNLQTEISTTLSKDTATIVQLSGSVEESHKTVGMKAIRVMETPFAPPPNLKIGVSAPWIEEAIRNIKLFPTRQGQTTPVTSGISKILNENETLQKEKREIEQHRDILTTYTGMLERGERKIKLQIDQLTACNTRLKKELKWTKRSVAARQRKATTFRCIMMSTKRRAKETSDQLEEEMRKNHKLTNELEKEKRGHELKYEKLRSLLDEQKQTNIKACELQFDNLKRHLDDREDCLLRQNLGAAGQDAKYVCGDHRQRIRANHLK